MRFSTAASVAALAAATYAQDTTINVGQGGLKFDPQFVNATANSVITFVFTGGNHSVSQSSFAKPCEPLADGFSSGFVPVVSAGPGNSGTWNLTVTDDSKAIWFYCAQGPNPAANVNKAHCEAGMVGYVAYSSGPRGINIEKSGNTGDAYISNAQGASTFVQPSTTALSAALAVASATPIITSGTAPASASANTGASTGSQTSDRAGSSTESTGNQTVTNTNTSPAGASNTNAATSASGDGNSTTTATSANASNTNSGAGATQASGFFAFLAAALGVAVL
ncbi:hypothetical protein C8Q74DRAFT_1368184 [Fomes fomentarius]|nr:hypothetical protein C8Q74DRAFT_1368184 [Fomes fomentarius]